MSLATDLKIIKDAELDIELLDRENEKLCAENNVKVEGLRDVIKSTEFILEEELKASGEKKLECKLGYCSFRDMPDKWDYDEPVIIKWMKKEHLSYYHTAEILEKQNLKTAMLNDICKFDKPIPGVTVTPQEPRFNYEIEGGEKTK